MLAIDFSASGDPILPLITNKSTKYSLLVDCQKCSAHSVVSMIVLHKSAPSLLFTLYVSLIIFIVLQLSLLILQKQLIFFKRYYNLNLQILFSNSINPSKQLLQQEWGTDSARKSMFCLHY